MPGITIHSYKKKMEKGNIAFLMRFVPVSVYIIIKGSFILLAWLHYVLNLSYHPKLNDILRFVQEKVDGIPSAKGTKWKS